MPISTDALHHRAMLFDLSKPVAVAQNIWRDLANVDSVYSKLEQELLQAHGPVRVQKYECRLWKSKKSSTTDGKVIKHRHSSIRDAYLRNLQIKVSRPVDATVVIIECLDKHTHTYDIEKSFCIKNQAYCGTISKLKQPKIIPQPKYTMQPEVQVHMKVQSS